MSNQSEDGWYPECDECFCGNLGKVVCISCWNKRNAEVKKAIEEWFEPLIQGRILSKVNHQLISTLVRIDFKELLKKLGLSEDGE